MFILIKTGKYIRSKITAVNALIIVINDSCDTDLNSEKSRGNKLKKDNGIELFSGEFWSGSKSKELGLIDGIGDANHILKEIYGEDVVVKKFEKSKG